MSWQARGRPKTVVVTNKLAKEWSEMEEIREDRPLREQRIRVYQKVLAAGEFRPVTWAKVYIKEMDQYYRVNGKHTSTVFAAADFSKCQEVIAVIEDYECDTIEDAAKLYSTFDSQIQTRNQSDINRMFASAIPELKVYDTSFINLMVGAINYFRAPALTTDKKAAAGSSAAERAEVLFDEIEFCTWARALLGDGHTGKSKHLRRTPVVAAIRGTWGKAKAASLQFWTAVRDETGEKPELPDRKLAKWLTVMRVNSGNGARSGPPGRFKVFPREFYVKSIHAWNAWRRGESTNLQYYAAAKIPAIV